MKTLLIAAVAALAAGTTVTAQEAPTRVVSYGDLDLTSAAGRATLDSRVNAAAKMVCGNLLQTNDLRAMSTYRACRHQAVTVALASIDRPAVQLASR